MQRNRLALLLAVLLTGYATVPVQASENTGIAVELTSVAIDCRTLTENRTVTICVNLTENAGYNNFEFGIQVDERCTFTVSTSMVTYSINEAYHYVWCTYASGNTISGTGTLLTITLTLPEDAAVGDCFSVSYCDLNCAGTAMHIWSDVLQRVDYVAEDRVVWTDATITITEPQYGDINYDGCIDSVDAAILLQYLACEGAGEVYTELLTDEIIWGDYNRDGELDATDASGILKKAAEEAVETR